MKRLRDLFLILGFVLLALLIHRTGPYEILHYLQLVGWRFVLIIFTACLWQIGNTLAWGLAFNGKATRPKFPDLFVAKLSGDAINYITPLLNVGGEFVKPYLIRRHVPVPAGFASIVITKTTQAVTAVVYAALGLVLSLFFFDFPPVVWRTMVGVMGIGGAVVLWFFIQQQRHFFSAIRGALARLRIQSAWMEDRRYSVEEMDARIAAYYRQHRVRFGTAILIHGISWTFGVVETWLIVQAVGEPISFPTAFFLTTLSSLINTAFFFIPGGIGVWEGGQGFLFALLGLPLAMGVTVGLVKRIRKLFFVLAGLLVITKWTVRSEECAERRALDAI